MAGRRRTFAVLSSFMLAASAALVSAIVLPGVTQLATVPAMTPIPATTQAAQDLPGVEPADPKVLKALLPKAAASLKLIDAEAGRRSIGEMRSSFAQASFGTEAKPDAGRATVKLVDYIAMPGLVESAAPWQSLDIQNETDAEYRRTVMLGAHKALETYVKQTRSGSINVLVADRFVVTIEMTNMPSESLRQIANSMKLDKLAALAK